MAESATANKLNNSPIESINAEDIIDFCNLRREEGIDLDYKSDWPSDLEKVICSFANTQGGIVLIGVQEDEKSRKPKLPVQGFECDPSSTYQRIMNIAADGIYPPVSPEIKVCDLPQQKGKCVALIRILPSKLMHSTDRRRKVYVRVADNSRGYDLASISELEWLWDRRKKLENIKNEIYSAAIVHSDSRAVPWNSEKELDYWRVAPKLHVSIIPSIPDVENLIETDKLLDVAKSLPQLRSPWKNVDCIIPPLLGSWRSIPGGVCTSNRGYGNDLQYIEFGQFAHFHTTVPIYIRNNEQTPADVAQVAWAYGILAHVDIAFRFAYEFLEQIQYSWPITAKVTFESSTPLRINIIQPTSHSSGRFNYLSEMTTDSKLSLLDQELSPLQLIGDKSVLLSTAYNLFWAFGLGWSKSTVSDWIEKVSN